MPQENNHQEEENKFTKISDMAVKKQQKKVHKSSIKAMSILFNSKETKPLYVYFENKNFINSLKKVIKYINPTLLDNEINAKIDEYKVKLKSNNLKDKIEATIDLIDELAKPITVKNITNNDFEVIIKAFDYLKELKNEIETKIKDDKAKQYILDKFHQLTKFFFGGLIIAQVEEILKRALKE